MSGFVLAIDQGTTSSRAIIFDDQQNIISVSQREFTQHFPASGWVEHDVEEIWRSVLETCREAIEKAGIEASQIAAIGITNQRETTVIWDAKSGAPIHHAIVWQDRRTADTCDQLKSAGHGDLFTQKTGLLLDPYFSGTKIAWLLDHVDGARPKAENGDLLFGTIDTYLLWKLTGGRMHKTDATNASRTLLYNIHGGQWDDELCRLLNVPKAMLPSVEDCDHRFGVTVQDLFGAPIPIAGVAGDQHAATIGQACFKPGMVKSTYGTGCFAMLNTGTKAVGSTNRLLTTIGYQLGGETTYALEGSIFIAGAAVQWLRDGMGMIDNASQSGALAAEADPSQDIILVPAFAGLGAPYWEPNVRGSVFGLTRNTGPREFAKACLEAVCYQTSDLIEAMSKDIDLSGAEMPLRVDGGMVASEWTMQCLSNTLGKKVDRPQIAETTALGAAWLAGKSVGVWPDREEFSKSWKLDRQFQPETNDAQRAEKIGRWKAAVNATIAQSKG
ncbi:MAG: glycerol kinase GlpK [Pseudomonadota bacterium]